MKREKIKSIDIENDNLESFFEKLILYSKESKRRILIGVAGVPSSGKTTLSSVLKRRFPNDIQCLSMDGFHLYKKDLNEESMKRRGGYFTFDSKKLFHHLNLILDWNSTTYFPSFEHNIGDPIENDVKVSPSHSIIVIEGLYMLFKGENDKINDKVNDKVNDKDTNYKNNINDHIIHTVNTIIDTNIKNTNIIETNTINDTNDLLNNNENYWIKIQELLDIKLFVDIPIDIAMKRLLKRHMEAWNITSENAQKRIDVNDSLNAQLVLQTKTNADYFIFCHSDQLEYSLQIKHWRIKQND